MRREHHFSNAKRGAVVASPGKTRITIMLDDDLIEHFLAIAGNEGVGYRTSITATLRTAVASKRGRRAEDKPITVATLRKVLREELRTA